MHEAEHIAERHPAETMLSRPKFRASAIDRQVRSFGRAPPLTESA